MNTIKAWFVHWKTSLAGIVAAGATLYSQGHSIGSVAVSVGIAVLGLFSTDAPVTPSK